MSQQEPTLNISEADIRAVYQEGEKAVVLLVKTLLAPIEHSEVVGYDISEETLYNVRAQCFEQLAPVAVQLKASLERSGVIHYDETRLRFNSQLWSRYVACTASLTDYFVPPRRRQDTLKGTILGCPLIPTLLPESLPAELTYHPPYRPLDITQLSDLLSTKASDFT